MRRNCRYRHRLRSAAPTPAGSSVCSIPMLRRSSSSGHTGPGGQLLRRCGEIPAVLQTAHQIVEQLPLPLRHLQPGDLAAQEALQRLRQTAVGADTVHGGVLFLLIGPLIVAVLAVVFLQPAPAVQPALGLPGQRLLLVGQLQLHRGVLLRHALQILPHLQPPHLQQPQAVQLPHGQLLLLPQLQLHCASLPNLPSWDLFCYYSASTAPVQAVFSQGDRSGAVFCVRCGLLLEGV